MEKSRSEEVELQLTQDEALVLDSLLSRFDPGGERSETLTIHHPAERAALWALQAALERILVDPFQPDYDRRLAEAQTRLRKKAGL